jgi:hypothetical protein
MPFNMPTWIPYRIITMYKSPLYTLQTLYRILQRFSQIMDIPQRHFLIQHYRQSQLSRASKAKHAKGTTSTYIDFNEDIVTGVVARDVHYFENTVTETRSHVDYLLELGV